VGTFKGEILKKLAEQNGWADEGPGANHPFVMKKAGQRPVPIRAKLTNMNEARDILKQLKIPRAQWPDALK
jgi:hypothetical protein